jgi:hypothetical protein
VALTIVNLICAYEKCRKLFSIPIGRFNPKPKGHKFCCSPRCACLRVNDEKYCQGEANELITFKLIIERALQHRRGLDLVCNLTPQYLKKVWDTQKGICPYTGWNLILPRGNGRSLKTMAKASLDRIESSKGYVVGNVQFVALAANLAKSTFTHDEMTEFCKAIALKWHSTKL